MNGFGLQVSVLLGLGLFQVLYIATVLQPGQGPGAEGAPA